MKQLFTSLSIVLIVFFLSACKKSATIDPNVSFSATMSGANETPTVSTSGTGTAVGTFNNDTKILSLTISYSGMTGTVTAGHIHKGPVGTPGPVLFPFSSTTSPITFTSPVLDSTQISDLKEGNYYVNLHTAANPRGEIRGQLLMQ